MNVKKEKNILLNGEKYLFSDELQTSLELSTSVSDSSCVLSNTKNPLGLYLVMFRLLNVKTGVIVYNYIYYPSFFKDVLLLYIFSKTKDEIYNGVTREWGDFLSVIDYNIFYGEEENIDNKNNEKLVVSFLDPTLKDLLVMLNTSELFAADISYILYLINRLIYVGDGKDMFNIISSASKKDYVGFIKEILGTIPNHDLLMNKVLHGKIKLKSKSISMINSCLFLVHDLDKFIKGLKDKGLQVNCGPQSQRGENNSIINFLNCLDTDFRFALYNHHKHHTLNRNPKVKYLLDLNKFSFRNVHMNIGNVRYYSTN